MLAHARRRHQVVRPGAEPVGHAGQRADRADLDRIPGEIRVERHSVSDRDLLLRAALEQLDQVVTSDLISEPGAPGALHAAFPVQQHLGRQRHRFGERPLVASEPGLALPGGHRLILQRALTALVAHGAVERMVDQQHLHHAALRLLGDLGRQLGADDHPVGAGGGAGGRWLELALDLDEALPAGPDRGEQRVIAEPRYLDAEQLGGPDHERAPGHGDLEAVDGHAHAVGRPGQCRTGVPWSLHCHRRITFRLRRTAWKPRGRTGSRRACGARCTHP